MTTGRKRDQECPIKHTVKINDGDLELCDQVLGQIKKLCSTLPVTDYTPPWSTHREGSHTAIRSFFKKYEALLSQKQVDIYSNLTFIKKLLCALNDDIEKRASASTSQEEKDDAFAEAKFLLAQFVVFREDATQLDSFKDLVDQETKDSPFFHICQNIHFEYAMRLKNNAFGKDEKNTLGYAHRLIESKDANLSKFKELFFPYRFVKHFYAGAINVIIDNIFNSACACYFFKKNPEELNYRLPSLKLAIKLAQSLPSHTRDLYIKEFLKIYASSNSMNFTSNGDAAKVNKVILLMLNTFPKNQEGIESKLPHKKPNLSFDEMKFLASNKVNDDCFNVISAALEKGDDWGSEKELIDKDIRAIIGYFEKEHREAKDQVSEEFYEEYFEFLVNHISAKEFQFNLMLIALLNLIKLRNPEESLVDSAQKYITSLMGNNNKTWKEKVDDLNLLKNIFHKLDNFSQQLELEPKEDIRELGREVYYDIYNRINVNLAENQLSHDDVKLLSNLDIIADTITNQPQKTMAYRELQNAVLPGKGNPRKEQAGRILQYAALAIGILAPAAIFVASGGSACLGLQIGIALTALVIIAIGECIKRSSRDKGAAKNLLAWLPKVAPAASVPQPGSGPLLEKKG